MFNKLMIFYDRCNNPINKPEHIEPKQRVSAYGLYIKDGKVLVVKPTWQDKWELPGGGAELNEKLTNTVIREFMEETGYKIEKIDNKPFKSIKQNFYADDIDEYFYSTLNFFNVLELSKKTMQDFDRKEINKVSWKSLASLNTTNFRPWHLDAMIASVQFLTTLLK